jgi:hypothetical protein
MKRKVSQKLLIGVMFGLLFFCTLNSCIVKEGFIPRFVKEGAKVAIEQTKDVAKKTGKVAASAAIQSAKTAGSIVAVGNAAMNAFNKAAKNEDEEDD